MMKRTIVNARTVVVIALVTLFTFTLSAKAKDKNKTKPQAASVIAHLPLEGAVASQMFLQVQGDKRYLYIDQGSSQGYTVVDVTKSNKPAVVRRSDSGKVQIFGSETAIAEAPDQSKTVARSHPPTESVTVLDTSDPANPKTIQTFKGVTALLQDNSQNLVFLTNSEGLWVLKHAPEDLRPARKKPPCGSESAISAMPPDCE